MTMSHSAPAHVSLDFNLSKTKNWVRGKDRYGERKIKGETRMNRER